MTTLPHIYISGPMTGLPDNNFPAFDQAFGDLIHLGYTVTSPAFTSYQRCYEDYLRSDFLIMAQINIRYESHCGLALLPGWENSNGAKKEYPIAQAYGWEIHPLSYWLSKQA